jgi:hypothetical protein
MLFRISRAQATFSEHIFQNKKFALRLIFVHNLTRDFKLV